MNRSIVNILISIRDRYGDMIFYNHQKTKNLIHDLAPKLKKERIHLSQFLEMNGYFQLKYAGHSYTITRQKLIKNYMDTYAVDIATAFWVLDVFSEVLGFQDFEDAQSLIKQQPNIRESVKIEVLPKQNIAVSNIPSTSNFPITAEPPEADETTTNIDFSKRVSADMHSVAVMADGTVKAVGPNEDGQCNVSKWRNIVAVSAGPFFTVGLCEDGTVVACGRNEFGQCNVKNWRNVVAISTGARHTVGLLSNGTVIAAGQNRNGECNVTGWRNVISVSAGYLCTFGIKRDFKVLITRRLNQPTLNVDHLVNVKDIANPYPYRSLVLKRDSRLTVIGNDETLLNNVAKWRGVKAISAGPDYFVGLLNDGAVRVLAYYWISSGIECNPDTWDNIVAVAAGRFHLLGVKKDGSMVSAMMHPERNMNKGQCKVEDWRLI